MNNHLFSESILSLIKVLNMVKSISNFEVLTFVCSFIILSGGVYLTILNVHGVYFFVCFFYYVNSLPNTI
jgi:hypothetical protein